MVAWGKAKRQPRGAGYGRIIAAPAGAQDRWGIGVPTPLPGRESNFGNGNPGAPRGTAVPRSAPGYPPLPLPGQ
jgi:hypothetical protein